MYSHYDGSSFPNRNAWTPPLPAEQTETYTYQHPTPLSENHANPFKSSPPEVMQPDILSKNQDDLQEPTSPVSPIPRKAHLSIRQTPKLPNTRHQAKLSFSGWMESYGEQGAASKDSDSGGFVKIDILGPKNNTTGTPENTGTREVGSNKAFPFTRNT